MKRTSKKQRIVLYCIIFLIIVVIPVYILQKKSNNSSTQDTSPLTDTQFALNTVVTITLYDTNDTSILEGAFSLCNHYETIFSRTLETSELYQVNHSDSLEHTISDDLKELIEYGLKYSKLSDGAFDISVAPVSQLWDFTAEDPVVPDDSDIKDAIQYVGYNNFTLDGNTLIRKSVKNQLDLGAIAKGFIADKIKTYLLEQGVNSALINLGGNILCVGDKLGEQFHIGIQAPFKDQNVTLAAVKIADKSIVTSGIYERYFYEHDTFFHHILDPKTGYSYDNDLSSVTIISDKSVDGDALSTMCFALGFDEGIRYVNGRDDINAIFVTRDGEVHYSKGFTEKYEVS